MKIQFQWNGFTKANKKLWRNGERMGFRFSFYDTSVVEFGCQLLTIRHNIISDDMHYMHHCNPTCYSLSFVCASCVLRKFSSKFEYWHFCHTNMQMNAFWLNSASSYQHLSFVLRKHYMNGSFSFYFFPPPPSFYLFPAFTFLQMNSLVSSFKCSFLPSSSPKSICKALHNKAIQFTGEPKHWPYNWI